MIQLRKKIAQLFSLPVIAIVCCYSAEAYADFHYCTGEVVDMVTRGSDEGTAVKIDGLNNFAVLGYGGESYKDMHERQFSMLLSALMSNTKVTLEFVNKDGVTSCSDDHKGVFVRYVRIRK